MSKSQRIVLLFLCLSILSISAMAQSSNYSVNLSANKFLGSYLVNQSGFALYYYSSDSSAGGASTCYGACASTWKPFYAEKITLPDGVNSADFAARTRSTVLNIAPCAPKATVTPALRKGSALRQSRQLMHWMPFFSKRQGKALIPAGALPPRGTTIAVA